MQQFIIVDSTNNIDTRQTIFTEIDHIVRWGESCETKPQIKNVLTFFHSKCRSYYGMNTEMTEMMHEYISKALTRIADKYLELS